MDGSLLRAAREARNWSIDTLAKESGVSRRTVLRAEQGHQVNPETRRLLSECLGTTTDELGLTARRAPSRGGPSDGLDRREFLRAVSVAGALVAIPPDGDQLDWERMRYYAGRSRVVDANAVEEYAALNAHLWRVYTTATPKSSALGMVRAQLEVLTRHLERSHTEKIHTQLCRVMSDLAQLAGEILFDTTAHTDASSCYALAAVAAKEARDFDLWSCAMVRHSFLGIYDRQPGDAVPMLDLADRLAQRGDPSLSTRYWVNTVRARALAGIGEMDASRRADELAENVHQLPGQIHNGGWLRFDGTRLAEERGAWLVEARRPDLAEPALTTALGQGLSPRRRGMVLTDLAVVGALRGDPDHLATHTTAALDIATQIRSGVVDRKLAALRPLLAPYAAERRIKDLDQQLATLTVR